MNLRQLLAAAAAVSLFSLPGLVRAQTQDERVFYQFDDDSVVGDTLATPPPLLRIRPASARVTPIRPRASFVGELLKSVEAL